MPTYSNTRGRKNIFISYRVSDTAGETGRLVDSLKQYFYEDQIFMDIEKLEPGVDFTIAIARSLECCDVLLAVIGPNWLGKNPDGSSRIMNDNDWVRLELGTALKRNVRVVPVLVDGGRLPNESELPPELAPLVNRQAHEITNKRWKYDTDQLVLFLKNVIGIPFKPRETRIRTESKTPWTLIAVIGGGVIFLLILLLTMSGNKTNNAYPDYDSDSKTHNTSAGEQKDNNNSSESIDERIDGTWVDSNNLYYLTIAQEGNQLEVYGYSMAGENTGQGTGSVNGKNVKFKVTVSNFGILTYNTRITEDGTIAGTISYTLNGTPGSEAVKLIRSANAAN